MIRGVDRKIRKAVKDAAKAEGMSVGTWVRRALLQALDASAEGPPSVIDLNARMRILGARLSVLEKSQQDLHAKVGTTEGLIGTPLGEKQKRWRRTTKSR
jgi:hypothetical protein